MLCYLFKENIGTSQKLETLANFVHSKTGIPKVVIKLFFKNKQIQTSKDIDKLPSEANIHLKLYLFGGRTVTYVASIMLFCTAVTATSSFVANVVIEFTVTQNVLAIIHLLQTKAMILLKT